MFFKVSMLQRFQIFHRILNRNYNRNLSHDVIVIGGGHAGTEAAAGSARLGARTLLVTQKLSTIGAMSCNPSFGGIGKGHIMREVDALGGVCCRVCDTSGVNFRVINTSHGPAVWGLRAQIDRDLYSAGVQRVLNNQSNLEIIEGTVEDLELELIPLTSKLRIKSVVLGNGQQIDTGSVVLTTGTFLRGLIRIGTNTFPAGRRGEAPAIGLAKTLENLDLKLGRLKTGTPPRISKHSIDFSETTRQPYDSSPTPFSFLSKGVNFMYPHQLPCYVTLTNQNTRKAVLDTLEASNYLQQDVTGPRYCPSLESKVLEYPETSHSVFLEPEGWHSGLVYPQGLNCSMDQSKQRDVVRTIPGLRRAELVEPGYLVEYDYVDPRQLELTLELRKVQGLFLAGQINGTTGYEEAAGQGIVAGINAGLRATNPENVLTLSRTESYIGVMIDDLVAMGAPEPYRMFTSRSEYRLLLRPENADIRLVEKARQVGCISNERAESTLELELRLKDSLEVLKHLKRDASDWSRNAKKSAILTGSQSAFRMIRDSKFTLQDLLPTFPNEIGALIGAKSAPEYPGSFADRLYGECIYYDLVLKQMREMKAFKMNEDMVIPADLDYNAMTQISMEARQKLSMVRPRNFAQASRVPGVTLSGLVFLMAFVRKLSN